MMEDLLPLHARSAPQIAKGTITGTQLKKQIERRRRRLAGARRRRSGPAAGCSTSAASPWTSTPTRPRASAPSTSKSAAGPRPGAKDYSYASYWYTGDPGLINVVPAANIEVLKDTDGGPLDGTEVVVRYLESQPNKTADVQLNRITLKSKASGQPVQMPAYNFGFPRSAAPARRQAVRVCRAPESAALRSGVTWAP
ncbi:MAG: hypothetical protein MZW92_39315 [Comamonadaceae bacterium]|nr:hypothetical protein [Comamonadaceae bacterium]